MKNARGSSVAIVGIGGIYPDAHDLGRFWDNISNARSAAREVPDGRWQIPVDVAYDPEVGKPDHVYSRRGCFINEIPPLADLSGLAIDTALLADLDPLFHLLLHAGKRAFDDAITEKLNRDRIGVIIGNLALPSEKSTLLTRQWLGKSFEEALLGTSSDAVATDPLNRYVAGLPAGILAHALGLGGGSFTLDAACASSLYAVKLAMDELLEGRCDAMLTGGLSRPDPLYTQMGFSQLRALSKKGICAPFDATGDGLVVGEGAGIFLLKRTEDAVAHGDRIYGVIRAVGVANDVGGSLLAPMSEGQLRAMRAAYAKAGWSPSDVDLIECHATGTPVGDATEVASLRELWSESAAEPGRCVIGSVKSNIGHLLTAAGAAALTKVLLSMQQETLPPTAGFNAPQPGMELDNSPFTVLKEQAAWNRRREGVPRRAAVSAFGFGGINAHLLVEEWLPETEIQTNQTTNSDNRPLIAVVGMDARFGPWSSLRSYQERVLGHDSSMQPTPPTNWWGAQNNQWFKNEGLESTPFAGFFLGDVQVPTEKFRIPPREMEEMLPQQLVMLQSAAAAMEDAGLDRDDNLNSSVLIGIALDLNSTNFSYRWSLAERAKGWAVKAGSEISAGDMAEWTKSLRDAAGPALTANRTMGALGSVVASRIAREFRVGGPSFTISSEENSGIKALETAVRLLQKGETDRALVGAVDMAGDIRAVLGHHAVRPLSRSGRGVPFDAQADGSLIGEGAAAVVLKRLEDAERDGDRIYAVIRGIGSSSGTTLLPGSDAYCRAVEMAYRDAGAGSSVDYLEAAASGHPAEDRMEAKALAALFAKTKGTTPRRCSISSVKGDIGHCGAASGLASFVRGCLALYQEIIPGCRGIEAPAAELSAIQQLTLPDSPRYWLRNRADGPRRAGISSFSIDGSCSHLILEGWERLPTQAEQERIAPTGRLNEYLFAVAGENGSELHQELELLKKRCSAAADLELPSLARQCYERLTAKGDQPRAVALVARTVEELNALVDLGIESVLSGKEAPITHPALRDRLFYSTRPLGRDSKIAFVFPGSGNHFPAMGLELSSRWPAIYRRQDSENQRLRDQFRPELFWSGAPLDELNNDHKAVIFGQVATGCAVSDIVRSFGVEPQSVIGYSLGESAGLFALRAWKDRDLMFSRMNASTLFTRDLAGECRAARKAWGLPDGKEVAWSIGVVEATAREVRHALRTTAHVYLLIVNTPDECVIGGDAKGVKRMVAMLGCRFHPLAGVTTVHCEVAKEVAEPYHDLHLFNTKAPANITFYSGARGRSYDVTRDSAADAILAQAVEGIDFPAVVNSAYDAGVRLFLEMGPGSSCSRMIYRILEGRPHLARSACYQGQDAASLVVRMLANLVSERVALDLAPLFQEPAIRTASTSTGSVVQLVIGGKPFSPPKQPQGKPAPAVRQPVAAKPTLSVAPQEPPRIPASQVAEPTHDPLLRELAASQEAQIKAHEAFLRLSDSLAKSMADAIALQMSLQDEPGGELPMEAPAMPAVAPAPLSTPAKKAVFDRELCLEFARGSVAKMLGPSFSEADTFPTRVRLPDEPLMLVDRIVTLEGEARSMTNGRVVTEHDIHPGAWYLDGGRIPTCIAVEAGQADLFLSGYLGIDFITRGLAVYRLLDAVVTFHRGLPGPGDTIHYDIRIERFFRQGDTWLFRFRFDATVNNEPLLTMRDGCAGFFSEEELAAGKGIVRPALDLRPTSGIRPADWQELVPMARESYSAGQLDRLRQGDLAGCFGDRFAGLAISDPLTIPGNLMRLVHRVNEIDPTGGRYGLGIIRAEADIKPDDWFLTCHFVDDRVMPGTLMYECCMHTLRIFLLRMGWVAEAERSVWEPVPGIASGLRCRGQVLETTKVAGYEVSIRELGYGPEPYAICDALMYADGRPIVEITNMSVRLTGTTQEQLAALWSAPAADITKPAIYTKEQILAYSNGKPSLGFGEPYRIFDSGRKIARLPGPPFQFMDRITGLAGEPWQMTAGAMAEAQYDLPADAWFFTAERQPAMPFAVLLEAALQPCGWLAAYVGSALTSPVDLSFRNLGGSAIQHRPVTPDSGTLTAVATMKKVATSGGMIIQEFDFSVADRSGLVYNGETMFGFFSREALANQVGIRDANPYQPTAAELDRGSSLPYPEQPPFPEKTLRMIDRIELFVPDGGPAGLGYIRGIKDVDPDEWFFKAHFFEDPVTPGSLGLESFLQLLKYAAHERFGMPKAAVIALGARHRWLYRGQIVPSNSRVTVEAWITATDEQARTLTADGFLSVDGKMIYQMNQFTVVVE
ncbi:type I polyketide synthase [Geobacter pelophilus]|uniref:Type I polyketide synthase n=1 Tax=Geoanaerobacter pelophilus TaxID=60036 RepID=A0AAW4L6T3_9BACT|nr:beta-ketoacyl synthase N-terminal-like domain-containing protein [Geoanaerobacter pelophilus]MBT0664300.1 type I polyketide synthase [Geoanaerobacter pelophilus]